ncbi:hypothetical protein TNCV_666951 [Trichonephila clavipes]|nr:hypothetical protein TNCV_666951 [Trichonephila clavipes]
MCESILAWTFRGCYSYQSQQRDMEIYHKSGAGRPVRCNVDHLLQKVQTRSMSTLRQLGYDISIVPQLISHHLVTTSMVKKPETWATCTAPGDQ